MTLLHTVRCSTLPTELRAFFKSFFVLVLSPLQTETLSIIKAKNLCLMRHHDGQLQPSTIRKPLNLQCCTTVAKFWSDIKSRLSPDDNAFLMQEDIIQYNYYENMFQEQNFNTVEHI